MQKANEHGVCDADTTEELARRGRAHVSVKFCKCEDGLYRYALDMAYSYGGFCGPISVKATGFASQNAAREAATQDVLRRFPKAWASES